MRNVGKISGRCYTLQTNMSWLRMVSAGWQTNLGRIAKVEEDNNAEVG
jgi:hypothetical protein